VNALAGFPKFVKDAEYSPWEYIHHFQKIVCVMRASSKQVQPPSGPEKAFGEILRANRRGIGISQEELAFESDLDRTTVSLMERGLISPSLRTIVRLCKVLRVRLSELARQIESSNYYR